MVSHIFSPRLRELLESNAVERVVVGYSGGVDSHVLLHELVKVITDTEQQSSVKIRHVSPFILITALVQMPTAGKNIVKRCVMSSG